MEENRAHSYEESLARGDRRAAGIYYTPCGIVTDMLTTITVGGDESFCDPCCGGGNFLIGALNIGLKAENIYGYDCDPMAVEIARERIKAATGFDATENIRVADFWSVAPTLKGRFDIIASNPPWGSKIDLAYRKRIAKSYDAGHSIDSSALMFMAALTTLKEGGRLVFLLPDAFFNIGAFEDVRRKVLELEITHLRDYGKPFKGLMTRAESITLINRVAGGRHRAECRYGQQRVRRTLRSFRANPKSIINMWVSEEGAKAAAAVFAKPHITLAGRAQWGMGIVTGDNARHCHAKPRRGDVAVVRGYNVTREGIVGIDTYMSRDLSRYQQAARAEFYEAEEKIIYRFISNEPIFCCDREQHYILNSANALIPDGDFPLTCEQIVERLNSRVISKLFKALFRTHKILRHDIETLPLHTEVADFSEEVYQKYLGIEPSEQGCFRVIREVSKDKK